MAQANYQPPTMKIDIWQKDMAVIGEFATKLGVAVPVFAASAPIYNAAIGQGLGGDDTAAVCAVLERMAGMDERRKP
jgi:3-hydroxyisobutyrate dehydrogenase-like beta-hydroxyacid dehydrogenase